MKRHADDMSKDMDSDSEFNPFSQNLRNGFNLSKRVIRKQPEDSTDRRNVNKPRYTTILEVARPVWPANDAVTPAISERRIRELENGNDEEKLMAAFARHVVNPGRHHRNGSQWVSRNYLRKIFPDHFGRIGFLGQSSWKTKKAGDFGLPDLFFRSVDPGKANLSPHESIDDLFEDLGQAPALKALTDEEHQHLQNRYQPDEHNASLADDQPQSPVTSNQSIKDFQDDNVLNTTRGASNVPRPSKRLRSMSSTKSQLGDKTAARSVLVSGWVTPDCKSLQGSKASIPPEIKHSTLSRGLGLSTSDAKSLGDNNTRVPSQKLSNQQLSPDLIVSA